MKLRQLEISGFKSFVDPVTLDFATGITGIVGPNGCGKSNLSDAISWVLGEQSAKSLRSDSMDDVIFAGSERRKPLGMAEVVLTLEADASVEGAEEGVLQIARRVYRGGQGEYRLNGKRVRLKEIRDLLMGTGLGIRAYSIIEQGKIGLILSGKPQERRKLLEEAAGVTRYKERRRVAEVKLEEATANLLRLDDIISEVERALRTLKRQAAAAQRFQAKQGEYREALESALLGRWGRLGIREAERLRALEGLTDEESRIVARLHHQEAVLAAGRERLEELGREVAELHRVDAELAARIEGRQQFVRGSRETLQQLGERLTAGRTLAEERSRDLDRKRSARTELAEARERLVAELDEAGKAVEGDRESLSRQADAVAEAEAELARSRARLMESMGAIERVRNELNSQRIEIEKATLRRQHLLDEIADHERELAEAEAALAGAVAAATGIESEIARGTEERTRLAGELERALARETELTHRLQAADEELRTLRQRQQVLAQLAQEQARSRRDLVAALANAGVPDPTFLADALQAPEGWERSVDLFLGELADAVLVADPAEVLPLGSRLAAADMRATLVTGLAPDGDPRLVDDPAIVGSVAALTTQDPALAAALPPAFLVETAEQGRRLAARHPGIAFLARDGVWCQGGLVHIEGARRRPGALERKQEAAALGRKAPRIEERIAALREELEGAVARRTERAQELHRADAAQGERQRALAVAQARREDAAERRRRLERQSTSYGEEKTRLAERLVALEAEAAARKERLGDREGEHRSLEEAFDAAQSRVNELRQQRENLRTEGAARRGRLDLLTERLRSHDLEGARLEREGATITAQLASWDDEAARLEVRRRELEEAIEVADEELAGALEARDGSQQAVLAAQERLEAHREELRDLDAAVATAREEREGVRGRLEEGRLDLVAIRGEIQRLRESFAEHLGRPLPEVAPPVPDGLEEIEARVVALRDALDRMGPVNVLAAEEFAEQEERHGFLVAQRADVAESVKSLKETIREINATSTERFRAAFEAVNAKFGEVFTSLFKGGEAEMRLLDDEDLLESGIEIVARPPGKRLQNLMLLSGGEKALTAIALLMALFHTKPSPFCILDEVDAPLDDPNTVRFVEVIRGMATDTQFIVITHNKLTMNAASTLYGVTMQERGVSKVVSVSLDAIQPDAERISA